MIYSEGRADQHTGLLKLLVLSFVGHMAVLSLLVFTPAFPTPKWTFGPAYTVQLVSMPVTTRPERKEVDQSFKELMEKVPPSQDIVKKEATETLSSIPIAPVEIRKKTPPLDTVLEEIKKNVKQPESLPAVPEKALPEVEKERAPVAAPPGGKSAGDVDEKMKDYYARIWSRIRRFWTLPQGILPRENIEVVIHAVIARDGTIMALGFEKRSGNRFFDESAERSVKKASPFPPLPHEFREKSLEVGIRFHSYEFQ